MKKIVFILLSFSALGGLALKLDFKKNTKASCPFCKGEVLDLQAFYRGDKVLGVLTHKPAVSGHVLIVPERHVERLEDLTREEWASIGNAIREVDGAVRKVFGNKDYLILQKNGRGAGQSVPHLHFHYVPGTNFLAARFLIAPWLKPLNEEEIKLLRETLSESF